MSGTSREGSSGQHRGWEVFRGPLGKIGYACAYTPLALIEAAGFAPYRILPLGELPDRAGHILHDNICPHVKRLLDRALEDDLPELAGVVFMNSCEAMRRLSDAWRKIRPGDRTLLLDLPITCEGRSVPFFRDELVRLAHLLGQWRGRPITANEIEEGLARYAEASGLFMALRDRLRRATLPGGGARLQGLYNRAATEPIQTVLPLLRREISQPEGEKPSDRVPVLIFGNVMPDPELFSMIESCGAQVTDEDLCTGSRLFNPMAVDPSEEPFGRLARGLLSRGHCARTFDPAKPLALAESLLSRVKASGVRGVIGHTVKFCDPYLSRFAVVREVLKNGGMPFLLLEGDCTLRSMGQQKTRIEAFVEMLRLR